MTETDPVEAIYEALDRGDAPAALAMARVEMQRDGVDDPVLLFLAGIAQLELDQPAAAAADLGRAVQIDPDDAEFQSNHALALYRSCRFDESAKAVERALELEPGMPDAHYTHGLLLERRGEYDRADEAFARAAKRDPEAFPVPVRMTVEAFAEEVHAAGERLPDPFRKHLREVETSVDGVPSDEVLFEVAPPLDPELLGLFQGVPIGEENSGAMPSRILIFQRNLERNFPDRDDLRKEIVRTLHHELGHYLGLEEDELEAIDLG